MMTRIPTYLLAATVAFLLTVICHPTWGSTESDTEPAPEANPVGRTTASQFLTWLTESERTYEIRKFETDESASLADEWWPPTEGPLFPYIEIDANGSRTLSEYPCDPVTVKTLDSLEGLFQSRDYAAARSEYLKLADRDPDCYTIWSFVGDSLLFEPNPEAALPYYEKATDLNPWDYRSYFYQANTLFKLGRYPESIQLFREALQRRARPHSIVVALERIGAKLDVQLNDNALDPRVRIRQEPDKVVLEIDLNNPHWLSWASCQAVWRHEPEYRKQRTGSYEEVILSSEQGVECLLVLLESYLVGLEDDLAKDPKLDRLLEIAEDGLLEEYWAYEIASRVVPDTLLLLPLEIGLEIDRYVTSYVLVATNPQP